MKIWHISDTHCHHNLLTVPEGVDMIIFSGDCSNPKEPVVNQNEVLDFIKWMKSLDIKYKVFVAGNHDTSIERNYVKKSDMESQYNKIEAMLEKIFDKLDKKVDK